MGWLFMRDCGPFDGPRAYLDDQFTYVRDDHRLSVLRSALVGMRTYYAACERITTEGEHIVFAMVCLVRLNRRAADGMTFGYKDICETMGPCEAACPAAILDLLTPTDNEYALAWRDRCRAALRDRAALRARPTPRPGQTILFDTPLRFSDGIERSRFEVVAAAKGARAVGFRDPLTGARCRIGNVKHLGYRLVDRVYVPAGGGGGHD